jgi:hypothetical protein
MDKVEIRFVPEGMIVTLRRSKTNQEGAIEDIGIARGRWAETCPVRALEAWLNAAHITQGPIFRPLGKHGNVRGHRLTDHAVGLIIKRAAERAGLDPAQFSGHSLRAGLVTSAYAADVPKHAIQAQTWHQSERMLRTYKRSGILFTQNASGKVGLCGSNPSIRWTRQCCDAGRRRRATAWRRRRSPGVRLEQLEWEIAHYQTCRMLLVSASALLIIAVGVGRVVLTH